jgi:lipopolysaccharide export system protein LptC
MNAAAGTQTAPRYPRRLGGIRRTTFAGAQRYTVFVRVMKRVLPAAAAALALAVVIYAVQPRETSRWVLNQPVTAVDNDHTMTRPKLTGTDQNGSPFTVTADSATQDGPTSQRVKLNIVQAQITMRDGMWVKLEARTGYINNEQHSLDLGGGLRLTADGGYEAHTATAHFDLAAGTVSGHEPVSGRAPYGTYTAQGFELRKEERQLLFTGGVSMLLHAAEAKR